MISVILIEPETPGNIGAIARVMKNFGFENLILINPKCNHLDKESYDRASHAKNILEKAVVADLNYLKNFHTLIATTSKQGTSYNIPRTSLSPEQLSSIISRKTKQDIGIVFGRESHGLYNREIDLCDFTVTIPCSKKYPAMNISHSVAVILYELSKKINSETILNVELAKDIDKKQIIKMFNKVFDTLHFTTNSKKQTQKVVWKKIIGKSFLSRREAFAVIGFLKKLLKKK